MSFTSASSRTESDSGHPGSFDDAAAICPDTPFSRISQAAEITNEDFPLSSTSELKGAVTILEIMRTEDLHNVCASLISQIPSSQISQDQNLHDRIYQASNTITTFLDTLLRSRMDSEHLIEEFPDGLCELRARFHAYMRPHNQSHALIFQFK
ncbi:hypothetical protein PHLCEN_2v5329 [Hermanssonia centrifuga]|uniref:Uncharacterized protein n=1 Tax=Hermanssonia centrifuga TaxID=98765 RepID=A0A2R6P5J0_9APHY|nr:hypothetical protein PHLCEN_2v5329 [Hermanssonia centrifuga]